MAEGNKNTTMPWNEEDNNASTSAVQQPAAAPAVQQPAATSTETTQATEATFSPRQYEQSNEPERRTTYEDLYTALHPQPAQEDDSPKARRRERANRTIAALSDAIGTMGNIWATAKGGPNMAGDGKDTMSKAYDDMYASQNARRLKAQQEWLKGYETAVGKDDKQYNTDINNYFKRSNLSEKMRENDINLVQTGKKEERAEADEQRKRNQENRAEGTYRLNQRIGTARAEKMETENKFAPAIAQAKIGSLNRSNTGRSKGKGGKTRKYGNTTVSQTDWNSTSYIDGVYATLPSSVTGNSSFSRDLGYGMTVSTKNKRIAMEKALRGDYGKKVQQATEKAVKSYGK